MNLSSFLANHPRRVLTFLALTTALISIPFISSQPTEAASQEPTGVVFDARDSIEERFVSNAFYTSMLVEDRSGDLLRVEPLLELHNNLDRIRSGSAADLSLLAFYHPVEERTVTGIWTIADMIDERLPDGLAGADDLEVKTVARSLIESAGVTRLGLSQHTTFTTSIDGVDGLPASEAVRFTVVSNDEELGFGGAGVRLGTDTEPEEYSRRILEVVRGDESTYQAWGLGIDINLTSAEEGDKAGPFIALTVFAILLVVGLAFRSYWATAVTGAGVAVMFIWLGGISNLLGLKSDLLLSFIVPIAMVSFGVDFTFHALSRYQEQRRAGLEPTSAFATGMSLVMGALVLALASDSAAFLTNTASGIESIVQFGIGAAVALLAAFVLLGLATPLVIMMVENRIGPTLSRRTVSRSRKATVMTAAAGFVAALSATGAAIASVFVDPAIGLGLLCAYILFSLVVPYFVLGRGASSAGRSSNAVELPIEPEPSNGRIGNTISTLARRPLLVILPALVISVIAGWLALRLPIELDAKDFFSPESGFVVGLDKLDEHAGSQDGESAAVLIDADLTQPEVIVAISDFVTDVKSTSSPHLSRTARGDLIIDEGVISVIEETMGSASARDLIERRTGTPLTDVDGDGIPDSESQLSALLTTVRDEGIPVGDGDMVMTSEEVRSVLWISETDPTNTATIVGVSIAGSRQVTNIDSARQDMAPLIEKLQSAVSVDDEGSVVFTGGPIARHESLGAIATALQISLLLAIAICVVIAALFMRSIRYAVIVVVPILMVISWLYAAMFLMGFGVNLVTASIGAVSIGIGIDFSIHFACRYREEFEKAADKLGAIQISANETGRALLASAGSSVIGFGILAFAPMPLFASYGFLTAIMIVMALIASLVVLPCILVLST